jgi:hypothetical protein
MANRARSVLATPAMQASTPSLPRMAGPGAAPQVPVIDTGRGLQNLAAGLEDAGNALAQDQANRDALKRVEFEQQFQTTAAGKAASLDPMEVDYDRKVGDAYREAGQAIEEAAADQFHSQKPLLDLRSTVAQATGQAERAAISARRTATAAVAEAQYGTSALAALAKIRKDPDGEDVYLADFAKTAGVINPALPQTKQIALGLNFAQDAIIAKSEGLALAGRHAEARAFADAHQEALTPAAFRSTKTLIREIEGQQERDAVATTEALTATTRIKIDDATSLADLDEIRRQIEAQDRAGLFANNKNTMAELVISVNTRRDQIIAQTRGLDVALQHFATGTGVDDQKEADLVWATMDGKLNAQLPLDERVKVVAEFAKASGWVPTKYKRLVANAEIVSDPVLLASAAQIYDGMRKAGVGPNVDLGTDKSASRVTLTSALVSATGMLYDDAAKIVVDNLPDKTVLEARREQFKADFANYDADPGVAFLFSGGQYLEKNAAVGGFFGFGAASVTPEAAVAFEQSLRAFYELSGNKTVATTAAMQRFSAQWGVTGTATGKERLEKFPPERYFPPAVNDALTVDQKRLIIDSDVRRFLGVYNINPATVIGDKEDVSGIPDFQLAPDAQTERELAAGQRPSYEIRARNNVGQPVPVPVTRDDGVRINLRYTMPDAERLRTLPEYVALVEEAARAATDGPLRNLPAGLRPGVALEDLRKSLGNVFGPAKDALDDTLGYDKPKLFDITPRPKYGDK